MLLFYKNATISSTQVTALNQKNNMRRDAASHLDIVWHIYTDIYNILFSVITTLIVNFVFHSFILKFICVIFFLRILLGLKNV